MDMGLAAMAMTVLLSQHVLADHRISQLSLASIPEERRQLHDLTAH
jgi:hypothetical protein